MKKEKMQHTINVTERVWKIIAKSGKFGESASDVLLRLLEAKNDKEKK